MDSGHRTLDLSDRTLHTHKNWILRTVRSRQLQSERNLDGRERCTDLNEGPGECPVAFVRKVSYLN